MNSQALALYVRLVQSGQNNSNINYNHVAGE
jgi:hypothetical protein